MRFHDEREANTRPHVSLEGPIATFLVRDDAVPDLDFVVTTLDEEPASTGTLLFDSGELWKLFDEGDAYRIECRVYGELYKVAIVSKDLRNGVVRLGAVDDTISYPIEYPLDEVILNMLLARRGFVELHSCGIVDRNGEGYLFVGNSGDGKTTTARLWENDAAEILSDDRIIVRPEDGRWWMYGTPWHGDAEICSESRAPLRRIFVLDKSTANAVSPLSPAAAVAHLLSCTFPPFHDAAAMDAIAGTLGAIAADIPVTRFSFVNDHSAVDFVRRMFEIAA